MIKRLEIFPFHIDLVTTDYILFGIGLLKKNKINFEEYKMDCYGVNFFLGWFYIHIGINWIKERNEE